MLKTTKAALTSLFSVNSKNQNSWFNILRDCIYDALTTEYNFRFHHKQIQEYLKSIRYLPRGLNIEGTNICNAKCTFCAYPKMERPKRTMPVELFKNIIDQYIEMGGRCISLSPIVGDPMADPFAFERFDYLHQCSQISEFYFFTNAIAMSPDKSQRLLSYSNKLKIYISLGGFDRETYKSIMGVDQFDRVRQNIDTLIQLKHDNNSPFQLIISVRCPLNKCQGEYWEKICQDKQKGLLLFDFAPRLRFDTWAGKVSRKELKSVGLQPMTRPYKRGACELLYMKPAALANGKVNACACRDVDTQLIIGDLNDSRLVDIWNGTGLNEIIERQEKGDFPEVCKHCTFYVSVYNSRLSSIFSGILNWKNIKENKLR